MSATHESTGRVDPTRARPQIESLWEEEILPTLSDYVRIPNKSPHFDSEWRAHGHMERATQLIAGWCRARQIPGLQVEIVRLEGRTPLIFMEVPGTGAGRGRADTVLLYGHLDKQPEMEGWREGLAPWEPVRNGDLLYGRGGADDGYSAFASLAALEVLAEQGIAHARCVILIEGCEESGSYDLPFYIDHLSERIGSPGLVVCLDSGAGDYDRLWNTTSLRGMAAGTLEVQVLTEGVHSGDASGVVPDSFRVLRALLSRLEDPHTGVLHPTDLHVDIPPQRVEQAKQAAKVLGDRVFGKFPFVDGAQPLAGDLFELILNRTWRPTLTVTGMGGFPELSNAGNVLRPMTQAKLSLRLPPTLDGKAAAASVAELLERDPPYGLKVCVRGMDGISGWNAPPLAGWLEASIDEASHLFFGQGHANMGEGGTIPFMGLLGEKFPRAQFLITGVLGPASNAHGPNEFLHIPTAKKLTGCVAQVLARHLLRPPGDSLP